MALGFCSCVVFFETVTTKRKRLPREQSGKKQSKSDHTSCCSDSEHAAPDESSCANELLMSFEETKKKFEERLCRIHLKHCFVEVIGGNIHAWTKSEMRTSFEFMEYKKMKVDKQGNIVAVKSKFLEKWFRTNTQRHYLDTGIYPPPKICPVDHFNMWTPFAMESVVEYESKPQELAFILNHIRIIAGNHQASYDFLINWIAQMIQFPAVKTLCPVLVSSEGAGKTVIITLLLSAMLGNSKVLISSDPCRDVWGPRNGPMASAFLVNLNEIEGKDIISTKFKELNTDPKMIIHPTGGKPYVIDSSHRFIVTTNTFDGFFKRRTVIIRSSDEKIGDTVYFDQLVKYLADINVIKTCYEYFKLVPNMDKFNALPLPVTEYQRELMECSKGPVELWLKDFTINRQQEIVPMVTISAGEQFRLYNEWCVENKYVEQQLTKQKFGMQLTRLNIKGISKGHHSDKGETRKFDLQLLKAHFNIITSLNPID